MPQVTDRIGFSISQSGSKEINDNIEMEEFVMAKKDEKSARELEPIRRVRETVSSIDDEQLGQLLQHDRQLGEELEARYDTFQEQAALFMVEEDGSQLSDSDQAELTLDHMKSTFESAVIVKDLAGM